MDYAEKQMRLKMGKSTDDFLAEVPTLDGFYQSIQDEQGPKKHPRLLGNKVEGNIPVSLSDESRLGNMHIIGAPNEGKSRLMEALIRGDMQRGYGACLLDPGPNADTFQNVLKWCAYRNFKKVLIIDPHDRKLAIPALAPKHNMMDTVRILFDQARATDTPIINKYLRAVFWVLRKGNFGLSDMRYFAEYDDPFYTARRNFILNSIQDQLADPVVKIRGAFRTITQNKDFASTINRIDQFRQPYLQLLFGMTEGINFAKLIREGWLILVNLYPHGVEEQFEVLHAKLIAASVLGELFNTMQSITREHIDPQGKYHGAWKGFYYVYIDEVSEYITEHIARMMWLYRKLGLRFTVAHQSYKQLDANEKVRSGIESCSLKVAFWTGNESDRMQIAKQMFGGDLTDREVAFHLRQTEQRNAYVLLGKGKPFKMRLRDVPDAPGITLREVDAFKAQIYAEGMKEGWYNTREQILKKTNERFSRTTPAPNPANNSPANTQENEPTNKQPDGNPPIGDVPGKRLLDDFADSQAGIRKTKGRKRTNKGGNAPTP